MSDQRDESSGTTTLEDVFLSREFERSQRGAASGPEETPDVVSARQAIITVRFGSAHHVPDPLLSSGSDRSIAYYVTPPAEVSFPWPGLRGLRLQSLMLLKLSQPTSLLPQPIPCEW